MQADTLFTGSVLEDTVVTAGDVRARADSVVDLGAATSEAVGTVQGFANAFYGALPRIAVGLAVFALFWLVAAGVRSIVHRMTPGPRNSSIGLVLGRLTFAGLLVVGGLVALVIIFPTFTVASLVGALGIGGIAIGFAFQDIFQNLLAGILILLREPFRVGDEIVSGDYVGTVEAIETRATFIRTYDGRRVIIPNSQIYSDPVQVITAYHMVRAEYDVGIGYGDDIEAAKRIALDTLRGTEGVLEAPAPDVLTWDLAGSSVNLRLRWWTDPTRSAVVATRDRVLQAVARRMAEGGIDLPFPTQVVLFHDQTEETDGDRTRQREGWPAGDAPPAPPGWRARSASATTAADRRALWGPPRLIRPSPSVSSTSSRTIPTGRRTTPTGGGPFLPADERFLPAAVPSDGWTDPSDGRTQDSDQGTNDSDPGRAVPTSGRTIPTRS